MLSKNLRLEEISLTLDSTPIKGFDQMKIPVAGTVILPITLGEGKLTTTKPITFTGVRFNSGYNAILGREAHKEIQYLI